MKFDNFKYMGQKLSAAVIAGAITGLNAGDAHAQGQSGAVSLDTLVTQTGSQTTNIPEFISIASYIAGAALAAFGVFSLKKHVDDPNNEPLKKGLGRLAGGAGLLAIPAVTNIMINTLGLGGEQKADLETFGGDFNPFGGAASP